ncbi:MAG: 1,4-alpha-glucan branching protein GlgB [Lachnospiraceae bacterium]|jgi:1,4-alpha-glucan branching enzyme|nr:1,4-alpha-glucan branching protein GlgB [Lachnospiraceae bacterium]
MDKKLYDLLDWAVIEELVYSESSDPHRVLGPHMTEDGLLIQTLMPTAKSVTVKLADGEEYPMEDVDPEGQYQKFFAALLPKKASKGYVYQVVYDNEAAEELEDPYAFKPQLTETDLKKFEAGIHYNIYDKLGAHLMKIGKTEGVYFSVWAPCAMRVSVVGDFNLWDGRRHQMRKLGDSGIFELFIPGLKEGTIYKYEVKTMKGEPMLKADPYGNYSELRPNTASVVWDLNQYQWTDKAWMDARAKADTKDKPVNIYEVHLGSWIRKTISVNEDGSEVIGSEFYNYREIAVKLAEYVKQMGYTHIELLPVMEHPLDASWGYQVTGYYAPTSRYGTPDDFMYFMDYMHGQEIGVILDWVPAHFPRDIHGLACFDGSCVYEHQDPRQGAHPHWGTLIYNYGRPGVSNFLIANAIFWADKFHADGIRMDAVASMLYLDYGKNDGEWVANMYGGHENLEAVEFLKHLSSIFKGRKDGAVLIAEESTAWPRITSSVKDDGLGFDYKWNMGWMNDFLNYMKCDPYFRKNNYGNLTFSMLYAYSEDFILVFSHDEVVHGKASMLGKMPGESLEKKAENLRAAYGFYMGHPGKKLLFMGQEFGQVHEWNENDDLDWDILQFPLHKQLQDYVKALNTLYKTHPAMYQEDYYPEGFQWINCTYHEESLAMFVRQTKKKEETLLFVCNFDNVDRPNFRVGVPFYGKYKEILSSADVKFGGPGAGNPRAKTTKAVEWDGRDYSIEITIPAMSVSVFECSPTEEPKKPAKAEKAKGAAAAKTEKTKTAPAAKGEKTKAAPAAKAEKAKEATVVKAEKVKAAPAKKAEKAKAASASKAEKAKAASLKAAAEETSVKGKTEKKARNPKPGRKK